MEIGLFHRKEIMELLIKPLNKEAKKSYKNHGHFHDGDAGLDLYALKDICFSSGETKKLN